MGNNYNLKLFKSSLDGNNEQSPFALKAFFYCFIRIDEAFPKLHLKKYFSTRKKKSFV